MRAPLLILGSILALFFLGRNARQNPGPISTPTSKPGTTTAPVVTGVPLTSSPFGVMVQAQGLTIQGRVQAARDLGATYYRSTDVKIDSWNGTCEECTLATQAGLKLVLTVRTNGGRGTPSTPPSDLNSYKKTLGQILDTLKPSLLVVENEENSAALFYSGTPEQYLSELKAACEVAHTRGIKCTNGGIVSSLTVALVANSYYEQGQTQKAMEYLQRTLGSRLAEQLGAASSDPAKIFANPKVASQIQKGKALFAGYKSAGADFANFHWYVADTAALGEAVAYVSKTTGLQPISNEVGQQKNEDPAQVTNTMQKVMDLRMPYAVWFSVDVSGFAGARGLVDGSGTLRPNGIAYRDFITKNF